MHADTMYIPESDKKGDKTCSWNVPGHQFCPLKKKLLRTSPSRGLEQTLGPPTFKRLSAQKGKAVGPFKTRGRGANPLALGAWGWQMRLRRGAGRVVTAVRRPHTGV